MSDFARLEEKLGKLRRTEPRNARGRRLEGSDVARRLDAFVAEIDETILTRKLTFSTEAEEFAVTAGNRQLQAVAGLPDLEGTHVFTGQDDGMLQTLKTHLAGAFEAGEWAVRASRLTRQEASAFRADGGVPARALIEVWGLAEAADGGGAPPPSGNLLERFVATAKDHVRSWVLIEGEDVAASGGDAKGVDWIGERAGGFLDGYYAKGETLGSRTPRALAFEDSAGAGLIYVESDGMAGFLTFAPGTLQKVMAAWATVTRNR